MTQIKKIHNDKEYKQVLREMERLMLLPESKKNDSRIMRLAEIIADYESELCEGTVYEY